MIIENHFRGLRLPIKGFALLVGLASWGIPAQVRAICGLDGAAQEQFASVEDPDALWELNRQLMPVGRAAQSCMVCHLAGGRGPRNVFGSAVNTLLRIDDRENPVRQRDAGRRMADILLDPTRPDSPTFAEVFQQGRLPEVLFATDEPPLREAPARKSESITLDRARELVRETEAKSRWEILQLSRTNKITLEVAEALAEFRGEMLILGLKVLTPEVAAALARSNAATVWLHSLTLVSPEAAEALAKRPGHLVLTGLAELDSVPLAEKLVQRPGALTFPYLNRLSPEVAAALAKQETSGNGITLPALSTLTPETAEFLGSGPKSLYLGLTTLDSPAIATALAKSQAGVNLFRLRAATPEVIAILREAESIKTPPLESVYELSKTNE